MAVNQVKLDKKANPDRWFARHPFITLTFLVTTSLLVCLLAAELFLRTFTGPVNPPLYQLSPLYGYPAGHK